MPHKHGHRQAAWLVKVFGMPWQWPAGLCVAALLLRGALDLAFAHGPLALDVLPASDALLDLLALACGAVALIKFLIVRGALAAPAGTARGHARRPARHSKP